MDVFWYGRRDSLGKGSVSFLNILQVHQVPLHFGPYGIMSDFLVCLLPVLNPLLSSFIFP